MGIINCYDDMDMILSDFSEEDIRRFVSGREFAVIRIEADAIHNHPRTKCGWKFYPKYIHHNMGIFFDSYALQIDDGDEASGRTYLFIKDTLPKFRETEDVSISYPTIEQLIPMLIGKRLIYYADFIEDRVGVDDVINKHLQKDVFNIRNKHEYYLYDSFFRVQIFLQKITNACKVDDFFAGILEQPSEL